MDITQAVNFSGYSASAYSRIKSVSKVEKSKEVKELSEEKNLQSSRRKYGRK